MKKILSHLKPYRLHMIVAWSLMLIELAVELMLPFFLGKMIDEGIVTQNMDIVVKWGVLMLALALFSFIAGMLNSFYSSYVTFHYGYDIRQRLFEKVQSFSFKNLHHFPTSGLITRFTNDVRMVQNGIFMGLRIMLRAPLLVIGGVIMAFLVNWRISIVFLISVPALVLLILWVIKKASPLFTKVQVRLDRVNRVMQENLSGIRLIKAFLRKNFEESRFKEVNTELMNRTKSALRLIESSMPVLLFGMNMSLLVILWYGSNEVQAGQAQVGEVVAIINYALRVSMAITMFGFLTMALSRMKASADRLQIVMDEEVDLLEKSDASKNLKVTEGKVEFSQVDFYYPETTNQVLDQLSFTVQPEERIAIIGATGSGKSTLFQLIPRLYDTTGGQVKIDDVDVRDYPLDILRMAIGFVPQAPLLFTGSIEENIRWGKNDASKEEIIQAAKDAQIHETIMEQPRGYETKIGQKGVNLSGGQKQRVSIARALIRNPKILLLDDSTSSLDLKTESKLLQAIQTYGCTTFIVTQKIDTAKSCDRIILMEDGQILAQGSHEELVETSELYRKIVASQVGDENLYA
ncbi:ABC transporter ATP-binding protein [Allobacillus sp. GCM10007491]|uniref:ABC transporter ATP-binding protein n=1 Tax=Allobacillus saliphilus TaxID=2912308 RepID=A0A941CY73_9BACI|nr:ABC transporter ATP-binding protein [Allobacillus saliphilus]MBR7554780.1 ABC transporter ATP-binding protein [Allobacillus saliphilus]